VKTNRRCFKRKYTAFKKQLLVACSGLHEKLTDAITETVQEQVAAQSGHLTAELHNAQVKL
jgi:hypothetical protein